MNRIAVVGSGGAGKSTLSEKLSGILNITVYHLDTYFWKPGWQMSDTTSWNEINDKLVNNENWIIDGNFKSTMANRLEAADIIIFLDIGRLTCLFNAWKRYFKYRKKRRPDLAEGCYEKIDFDYYKWIWGYRKRSRHYTLECIENYGKDKNVIILKTKKEIGIFIEKLRSDSLICRNDIKCPAGGQP